MTIDGLASLAAEIQQITRGRIVLSGMGASSADRLMLLEVDTTLADRFVERMTKPRRVEYQDGSDHQTWVDSRLETPTEAALDIIGLTVPQLQRKMLRVGACVEGSAGLLLIEGSMVLLVLVDGTLDNFRALSEITRTTDNGMTYPLFEAEELAPEPSRCKQFICGSFV